jgi:hypothetical protein
VAADFWAFDSMRRPTQPLSGQRISLQTYGQRAKHRGVQCTARASLDADTLELAVGQHGDMAPGQVHQLGHAGAAPVEIIEVQFGAYLGEDDLVCPGDDYGRV